ncbi:MAG TPA: biotin/lipoyl-containing protein [Rubrivivax sp.]|jgi:biotin carboxyl carrier protein|nr:biotin/lipoyl-containing protein [Rubrivivax sp.]
MERKMRITVDGRSYNVTVEDLSEGSNQLYPQPGSMTVPTAPAAVAVAATAAPTAAPQASAGPGDVLATLGGMVESVSVTVGQEVAQGDVVVVLEAMKMKSPMVATRAGKVTRVAVKAGDAVEAGHVLVTIG